MCVCVQHRAEWSEHEYDALIICSRLSTSFTSIVNKHATVCFSLSPWLFVEIAIDDAHCVSFRLFIDIEHIFRRLFIVSFDSKKWLRECVCVCCVSLIVTLAFAPVNLWTFCEIGIGCASHHIESNTHTLSISHTQIFNRHIKIIRNENASATDYKTQIYDK